ncbi:MAG TPA: hypothetical protein VKI65_12405, partial [Gemmataceae bacterium]|nr:hypothetical protein [Gemmataceae bacterium]
GTDFLPLTESALATVAIPLTSAAEPETALMESRESTLAIGVLLASAALNVGGDEVENAVALPLHEETAEIDIVPNTAEDLPGFVIGLEEAFERNSRELRQGLFHPREHALPLEQLDALFREATGTWLPAAAERIARRGQLLADRLLDVLKPGATLLGQTLQSLGLNEAALPNPRDEGEEAAPDGDDYDSVMLLERKVEMTDVLAPTLIAAFFAYEPIRKRRKTLPAEPGRPWRCAASESRFE